MGAPRPVTPVGILALRLQALADGTDGPPELVRELGELAALAGGLEPYLDAHTSPESADLAALAQRTREHDWGGALEQEMLSGHLEGQLLAFLVRLTGARRVLEIGMFTGYSALAMAQALPDDGVVLALELDDEAADLAQACFDASAHGHKVQVLRGPALASLEGLAGDPFDLVFVDADKAGYTAYVDTLLDRGLLATDGLLCVDNTLMQGQPWAGTRTTNGDAIAAFNEAVAADPRVEQVLLPVRDGVTLVRLV